jgi:serine-type D-Ala-D-Ala carboxypeptidase/endopeptidase (penicillin-binding protein 4)
VRPLRAAILAAVMLAGCNGSAQSLGSSTPQASPQADAGVSANGDVPRAADSASWTPSERARLNQRLAPALRMSALSTSGIAIVDANGQPLFTRRERAPMMPASTFKVLVATAALETLGPNYRFETTLEAIDDPHDGQLSGDLYLVGSGDPTLSSSDLAEAAMALRRFGVNRVTGGVVGDASAFAGPEINPDWNPADLQYGFAAGTSALLLDEGSVELRVTPLGSGQDARLAAWPSNDAVHLEGRAISGSDAMLTISRDPTQNVFRLSGGVPGGGQRRYWRPVTQMPQYAAGAMRGALIATGISVGFGSRAGVAPVSSRVLWRHESAPLRDLIHHMLVVSDNQYADQLLRAVGTHAALVGTDATGGRVERDLLRQLDIPADGLTIHDGSGLAASNRIAPLSLALLLARAAQRPVGPVLYADLPRVGYEGTVRYRSVTVARGRTRAKSGHIAEVDALAGYVQTKRHGRVAFAILVNDRRADDGLVDEGIDRALDILAGS